MFSLPLNTSMRSSIRSLSETQRLMNNVTMRLSTGKRVNGALDNPQNYFTALSLTSRARELNKLMDSIGQAVHALKAADEGIENIRKIVEQAGSLAKQATILNKDNSASVVKSTKSYNGSDLITNINGINDEDLIYVRLGISHEMTGTKNIVDTIKNQGLADGFYFDILHGTEHLKITSDGIGNDSSKLLDKFDALSNLDASFNDKGQLVLSSTIGSSLTIIEGDLGPPSEDLNDFLGLPISESFKITNTSTIESFVAELNNTDEITSYLSGGNIIISSDNQEDLVITDALNQEAAKILGISTDSRDLLNFALIRRERTQKATEYNSLRSQVDTIAKDASYKGVNFLNGDYLRVEFNNLRNSGLDIFGVTFDALGLGLSEAKNRWESSIDINDALEQVNKALDDLKLQSAEFGGNLKVVLERERYTEALVNLLEAGANNLVLADLDEESAKMMSLQTRSMLGSTALSLASQSMNGILSLFGSGIAGGDNGTSGEKNSSYSQSISSSVVTMSQAIAPASITTDNEKN